MKRIFTFLAIIFLTTAIWAQSPQKMSYQAVIRNSSNQLVVNHVVGMKISILQNTATGAAVYVETLTPTTNANGLISIEIGGGSGFDTIHWANGPYFIKTETDPTGGTTYTITGTSQLLSVPFALYAKTAENGFSGNYNDLTNKPVTNGSETKIIAGTNVTVTGLGTTASPYVVNANNGGSMLAPSATIQAASNILVNSAILNGLVNANGFLTTVVFEWGLTTAYGSTEVVSQSPVAGNTDVPVSTALTGLQGNTTYHYRIKATNAVNITNSNDLTFTTTASTPTVTTTAFSDIKGNSAKAGGIVINNGGASITAQGLCWSTSVTPTISNSITTSFTDVMTGLTPNTIYYVRAYATNMSGTGYGDQISFNSGKLIGSTFGGGLVFYNDGNSHGLVCANADQSANAEWGCNGTTIGNTSTAINTGDANTTAIVLGCNTAGIAAKICYDLVLNTYSDWYLPSRDELSLMYLNLHTQSLGGFTNLYYWSSSETYANSANDMNFNTGLLNTNDSKSYTKHVRAVRTF